MLWQNRHSCHSSSSIYSDVSTTKRSVEWWPRNVWLINASFSLLSRMSFQRSQRMVRSDYLPKIDRLILLRPREFCRTMFQYIPHSPWRFESCSGRAATNCSREPARSRCHFTQYCKLQRARIELSKVLQRSGKCFAGDWDIHKDPLALRHSGSPYGASADPTRFAKW